MNLENLTDSQATLLGSGLSFLGGVGSNIANYFMNRRNVAATQAMNRENIAFQQRENEIARQREDTAYQRAAKDLQYAGLSKTLAAGHPAAAQSMTAPSVVAPDYSFNYKSPLSNINAVETLMAWKKNKAEVDNIEAQTDNVNAQTDTMYGEGGYYDTAAQLNVAKKELTNSENNLAAIAGEYKAAECQSVIDLNLAKSSLAWQQSLESEAKTSLTLEQSYTEYMKQVQISIQNENLSLEGEKIALENARLAWLVETAKYETNIAAKKDRSFYYTMWSDVIGNILPPLTSI